jgi:hypothetical protein
MLRCINPQWNCSVKRVLQHTHTLTHTDTVNVSWNRKVVLQTGEQYTWWLHRVLSSDVFVCVLLLYIYLLMTVCSALSICAPPLLLLSASVCLCVFMVARQCAIVSLIRCSSKERKKGVPSEIIYQRCNHFHPARSITLSIAQKQTWPVHSSENAGFCIWLVDSNLFVWCFCILVIM